VLDSALAYELATSNLPDHKEAAQAFIEKRKLNFRT
jgi:hypothetical protein